MNHGYPPTRAPVGPGPGAHGGPTQRLNELLDNIRVEFENESQRSVDYEGQSECDSIFLLRSQLCGARALPYQP